MNKLISIWIVLLYLCTSSGWAQPAYKATLPVINTTGYYKINLPYFILGAACSDLADIRIKDEEGKGTAWLLCKDSLPTLINTSGTSILQNGKYTEIKLIFPFKSQVSELVFYISSPPYYQRNLKLYPPYTTKTLTADGGKPLILACNLYTDTLTLSVNNGDDRPLTIDSIKAYTPKYYLITNLEQGMQYAIYYGDHTASFPEYDLSFSKYVSDSIPTLTPEYIEKLPVSQLTERSSWMPFLRTYGIWMVILFIILQILYIVRRLLKSPNR